MAPLHSLLQQFLPISSLAEKFAWYQPLSTINANVIAVLMAKFPFTWVPVMNSGYARKGPRSVFTYNILEYNVITLKILFSQWEPAVPLPPCSTINNDIKHQWPCEDGLSSYLIFQFNTIKWRTVKMFSCIGQRHGCHYFLNCVAPLNKGFDNCKGW